MKLRMFAVALAAVALSACATRGDVKVSPEGTLALRANQLVQALRVTVQPPGNSPIEQLVQQKRITAAEGLKVAEIVQKTFDGASQLAEALRVVDEAKTDAERQTGLAKASVLLQSIAQGLETAKITVGTEEGRLAVALVLRTASTVLLTVGSVLPSPTPSVSAAF